jgi:hypothetical protein
MDINQLVTILQKLDGDAQIVVFSDGKFYPLKVEEYNCNCGSMPQIFYIGPDIKPEENQRKFEL